METIATYGTDVLETVGPTYQTYGNILRRPGNHSSIHDTKVISVPYGPHPRNVLDLYEPTTAEPSPLEDQKRPILVFLYGGAYMFGDRILPEIAGGLVYKNIASFFTRRLGCTVIVADYRLVQHGAKFPSGGEDVDRLIGWMLGYFKGGRDLFLMGHSAGGSHIATWIFSSLFREKRDRLLQGIEGCRLRGTIFLSTPLSLTPDLKRLFEPYYGSPTETGNNQPISLMRDVMQSGRSSLERWPPVLVLVAELDPDSVHVAAADFKQPWQDAGGRVEIRVLTRHNHHSPPLSLGTQIEDEESWGYMVGGWINDICSEGK